ncbi:MAG: hypothetical protein HOU81_21865 [Hamadaea sp.]|uniref:hypothetical protein n=1 Tax=Hamadaea sp. TaxID=2024425 RepID=UPI001813DB48|nr:hypothetical protein [Hamadaea sp.]NUR73474.1 hypothetical protein [Hamadaea sp.]NUT19162.1 hypothetical protein [Hamadaea sp.]
MDNLIGILSAVVSVLGAIVAGVMTSWSSRKATAFQAKLERERHEETKAEQAAKVLSRYREPLLLAANSLQSRLYNAVRDEYLPVYLHCGDEEQEEYARVFTVYTLAEYLCWVEIIRRELRFLDLGAERENRDFTKRLLAVTNTLSDQKIYGSPHYRLFRGQQQALGELMMQPGADGHHDCLTYPEFTHRLAEDPRFHRWFARLLREVDDIADQSIAGNARIIDTQRALIDLIDFLDPDKTRLGADHREKYEEATPSPAPPASSSPAVTTVSARPAAG